MQKYQPVIPTVDRSATRVVKDTPNRVAKLLRFFFENPADASDMFADRQVSFSILIAANEGHPDTLANATEQAITSVLANNGMGDLTVRVTAETVATNQTRYNLFIQITGTDGRPVLAITAIDNNGEVSLQNGRFTADSLIE